MATKLGARADGSLDKAKAGAVRAVGLVTAAALAASGKDPWWVICEHDAAYTIQSKTRPTPEARDDGRPVRVVGPVASEEEADAMASAHYGKTLRGWAEAAREGGK